MERDFRTQAIVDLQVSILNAPYFHREDKKPYTREMFAGRVERTAAAEPTEDWRKEVAQARSQMFLVSNQPEIRAGIKMGEQQAQVVVAERMERVREARARGESNDVIKKILHGVA